MRDEKSFRSFYDVILLKSKSCPSMTGPRTRAPRRIEIGTEEPTYRVTAHDYRRRIYFAGNHDSQDKSEELKFKEKLYKDDLNISILTAQMEILQVLLKDGDYLCFDVIIAKIKELPNPEREITKEFETYSKKDLTGFPPLTSQTNLPTATPAES
ncbi:hypothetical protein P5673_003277, partial [Acropora cervicornis]